MYKREKIQFDNIKENFLEASSVISLNENDLKMIEKMIGKINEIEVLIEEYENKYDVRDYNYIISLKSEKYQFVMALYLPYRWNDRIVGVNILDSDMPFDDDYYLTKTNPLILNNIEFEEFVENIKTKIEYYDTEFEDFVESVLSSIEDFEELIEINKQIKLRTLDEKSRKKVLEAVEIINKYAS